MHVMGNRLCIIPYAYGYATVVMYVYVCIDGHLAYALHAHRISSQVFIFMSNKSEIIHVAL